MSESPDEVRAEIERTRRDLGLDVDALADKVSPSKIVDRQTDKVKGAFGSVRDRVMGAAEDASGSVSGAGSSAAAHVGDVKDRVVSKAEGSPLAVGLIAFGAGLLLASLFPASTKEKHLAAGVKEQTQPLVDEATEAAKEVGSHLKEPAQDAASAVRDAATDSAATVKEHAQDAATEVKDQGQHARENVRGA